MAKCPYCLDPDNHDGKPCPYHVPGEKAAYPTEEDREQIAQKAAEKIKELENNPDPKKKK